MAAHARTPLPEPPPDLLSQIGGGMEIGPWHVVDLQRFSMLERNESERVLDVGCGVGRTAIWLARYQPQGSYEGFDINPAAIAWCQREITSRNANFRFTHLDIFNAAYNPAGKLRADELAFPYPDAEFDLVCLFSVFTHLLTADFKRYLSEISRVLRDGGRLHATFFLLSSERRTQLEAAEHEIARSLVAGAGPARSGIEGAPEWMVAYDEGFVRSCVQENGLRLRLVNYGGWPDWAMGLDETQGPQDTLVAYRDPRS